MADISEADWQDIINTIIAEAAGEGPEGMRRVGETILNRAAIRGISPAEVVRQPHQYTGFSNPGPDAVRAQQDQIARSAAEAAWQLAQQPGDPTNGADHYHTNYVSPNWASSMPTTGAYGDHIFYRSGPVPKNALDALLTPSTREVAFPRARPETRQVDLPRARPQSPGDLMASMFGTSFSAPQDAATSAGLNDFLTRQTAADGNLTMPGQIDRSVGSLNQKSGLAEALAAIVAPRSTPAMPTGVKQSYAAQDGATSRSAITAASARQAADQLTLRNANQQAADAERNRSVVATIPTSGVGKPPATRVVQSVPVSTAKTPMAPKQTMAQTRADNGQNRPATTPKAATTTQRSTPLTVGATPSYAAQDRAVASRMSDTGNPTQFDDIAMTFGGTPQAAGSVNDKKGNERLKPNDTWTVSDAELAAIHGVTPPATIRVAEVQDPVALPRRRPATEPNNQVAVTQPPRRQAPAVTPASAYAAPTSQQPASSAASAISRTFTPAPERRTASNGYVYEIGANGGAQRVGTTRSAGMTAQQQYDWANALAAERARASAPMASSLHDRITSGNLWGGSGGSGAQSLVG